MAWGRDGHATALEKRIREIADSLDQIAKELEGLDKIRGDVKGLAKSLQELEKSVEYRKGERP